MFAETVDKLVLSLSGGKITSVMGLESPVTCERDDTELLTVCRLPARGYILIATALCTCVGEEEIT